MATKGAVDGDDDNAFDQTNIVAGVARAMWLDGAADVLARALFRVKAELTSSECEKIAHCIT